MQYVAPLFRRLDDFEIAYFWKDARGVYLAINQVGASVIGSTVPQVVGQNDYAFFEASSAQMMIDRDNLILKSGKASEYESVAQTGGKWIRFRSCKSPVLSGHLHEKSLIGISAKIPNSNDRERLSCLAEARDALFKDPNDFLNSMLRHLSGVSLTYPRAIGDLLLPMPRV